MSQLVDSLEQKFREKTNYKRHTDQSRTWFRQQARKIGARARTSQLARDRDRFLAKPRIGQLLFWNYDPKLKNELPYYDRYPMAFIVSADSEGFLGLNMHYLPPVARQALFKELLKLRSNKRYRDNTRLDRITWRTIKGFSNFGLAKAAVKRYKWTHVRSKFIKIPAQEWEIAVFLPFERFEKAGTRKVWNDSKQKANKR